MTSNNANPRSRGANAAPLLTVVIPVYNEEGAIGSVLSEWTDVLDKLNIDFELRAYNDGSQDGTQAILTEFAEHHPRVIPIHQKNRGHGPTLVRAYAESTGEWVFQTDSDGEMPASAFVDLWTVREDYEVIVGARTGRVSTIDRRLLTAASRLAVRALFGRSFRDVNSPFRLMRGVWLRGLIASLSSNSAAPNVTLAGFAARDKARIRELPVPHRMRSTGTSSLNLRRAATLAATAAWQILVAAFRHR